MSFNIKYEDTANKLFEQLNQKSRLAVKVYNRRVSAQELIDQA